MNLAKMNNNLEETITSWNQCLSYPGLKKLEPGGIMLIKIMQG